MLSESNAPVGQFMHSYYAWYVKYMWTGYCIAGISRGGGGKFSWMLGFVVTRGKKVVVESSLNHTPRARVEQWPLVLEWKVWYEVTTSIK